MANESYALSITTRTDTFSDYLRLDAYRANQLTSRAKVALGEATPIKSWFIPMPQLIERHTMHNYEVVEQSIAYSLQKGIAQGRQAQIDSALLASSFAGVGADIGTSSNPNNYDLSTIVSGLIYMSGVGSMVTGLLSAYPAIQDLQQKIKSEFTDTPTISMSTQEMKYSGTVDRSYVLQYQFIAKSPADVYGPTGILQILAELESWSFPTSYDDSVSIRDLIKTPPIFTLKHVRVTGDGGFSINSDSAPLAALGQPQLLVLKKVSAAHETKSVIIDGDYSYPVITNITLELGDMEPIARLEDVYATYGGISVPKLACRSEIYYRSGAGRGRVGSE